jgi:serine/threonine protein kinase
MLLKERYRIINQIGQGGQATIYKGEDTELGNRLVAIKEMSQDGLSPRIFKKLLTLSSARPICSLVFNILISLVSMITLTKQDTGIL